MPQFTKGLQTSSLVNCDYRLHCNKKVSHIKRTHTQTHIHRACLDGSKSISDLYHYTFCNVNCMEPSLITGAGCTRASKAIGGILNAITDVGPYRCQRSAQTDVDRICVWGCARDWLGESAHYLNPVHHALYNIHFLSCIQNGTEIKYWSIFQLQPLDIM